MVYRITRVATVVAETQDEALRKLYTWDTDIAFRKVQQASSHPEVQEKGRITEMGQK